MRCFQTALALRPVILLALATAPILPADSVSSYASGAQGGPYSACTQAGTTTVTPSCSYQQIGGPFSVSMSGQIQQGYGSISAAGHVSVNDVPYVGDTYDGDGYYLAMQGNYADHLYVPGSGQTELVLHFTGTGGINAAGFSCLNCNIFGQGYTSFGLGATHTNVDVFFNAGFDPGDGLDFSVYLQSVAGVYLHAAGDSGQYDWQAQLTLTGVDSPSGPVTSASGALYTETGVVSSTPEPGTALQALAGVLGLVVLTACRCRAVGPRAWFMGDLLTGAVRK